MSALDWFALGLDDNIGAGLKKVLELEEAKLEVQRTRTFEEIEEETWDVSMVAEYGDEIFDYMRELEVRDDNDRTVCAY